MTLKCLLHDFFPRDKEYYTGLTDVNGKYAFKELNNELLGTWNRWGTVTGGPCTVYANVGGEWVWNTNTCDQSCLYICEYIVPTPGKDKFCTFLATVQCVLRLHYTNLLSGSHSIMFEDRHIVGSQKYMIKFYVFLSHCLPFLV